MADRGTSGLTKAAKKNLRRKAARQRAAASTGAATKPKEDDVVTPEELKDLLSREMDAAKERNDKEAMTSLRQQIWVIKDMIAGVKTKLPDEELQSILEKLPISEALKTKAKSAPESNEIKETKSEMPKENGVPNPSTDGNPFQASEKKLRNLKKKLKEVKRIKEKIAKGEKLEKNQMEKAEMEASLIEEIEELELDISTLKLNS